MKKTENNSFYCLHFPLLSVYRLPFTFYLLIKLFAVFSFFLCSQVFALDNMVKISVHGKYKFSAIKIEGVKNTQLFLGDSLMTGEIFVKNESGRISVRQSKSALKKYSSVKINSFGKGFWITGDGLPKRLYSGSLEISCREKFLKLINTLPLEKSTKGSY